MLSLSIVALTGCATLPKEQVALGATEYNQTLEKAQNEMLLLNIVRASKRYPMYFTTLSDMKETQTYGMSGDLVLPFGKVGNGYNGAYSLTPKANFSLSPVYTVAPLTSKDFIQGMLAPIKPETLAYFWEQGWPKEMLLYLIVSKIEEINANGKTTSYLNYPNSNQFSDFQKKVKEIIGGHECKLSESGGGEDNIGPQIEMRTANPDQLNSLIEIQKAGMLLKEVGNGKWQLASKRKGKYVLSCANEDGVAKLMEVVDNSIGTSIPEKSTRIILRSPEGVIYYLGEILRAAEENKVLAIGNENCKDETLFFARSKKSDSETYGKPYVEINYEGESYVIPRLKTGTSEPCPNRSMHTLSLVSLLISKQQSGSDFPPSVGVVTTIGR